MKKATLAAAAAIASLAACAGFPTDRARSVHLHYSPVVENAVGLRGAVTVEKTQTNSYFAIVNCERAYCGVQDLGAGGRIFIFSVWDPGSNMDLGARADSVPEDCRTQVLFLSPGTIASRFGGEGTGAKTITDISWKEGERIMAQIEIEPSAQGRTAFTCSVRVGENGGWWKLATISTPGEVKTIGRPFASFIEDFWRRPPSASLVRRAVFSDFASRSAGSTKWIPVEKAVFAADNLQVFNIDAGRAGPGAFFLQTGGDTKNEHVRLMGTIE